MKDFSGQIFGDNYERFSSVGLKRGKMISVEHFCVESNVRLASKLHPV